MPFQIYKIEKNPKLWHVPRVPVCRGRDIPYRLVRLSYSTTSVEGTLAIAQNKPKLLYDLRILLLGINPADIFINIHDGLITSLYIAATCVHQ